MNNPSELEQLLIDKKSLLYALDLATELLPVPEHRQDDEWYEKQTELYQIYKAFEREIIALRKDMESE